MILSLFKQHRFRSNQFSLSLSPSLPRALVQLILFSVLLAENYFRKLHTQHGVLWSKKVQFSVPIHYVSSLRNYATTKCNIIIVVTDFFFSIPVGGGYVSLLSKQWWSYMI